MVLTSTTRGAVLKSFPRNFFVVEMKDLATDDLIVLVTLAGNQDQIVTARLSNSLVNCFAAIGNFRVRLAGLLNSHFSVTKNLVWIFSARIIGSQNYHVAQRAGGFAHRRALRAIAVATATEQGNDSSAGDITRSAQHVQ